MHSHPSYSTYFAINSSSKSSFPHHHRILMIAKGYRSDIHPFRMDNTTAAAMRLCVLCVL